MVNVSREDIEHALSRSVLIRNRYFVDLSVRSCLRGPALPESIRSLEKVIGGRLPDSYRMFLSISNGWDYFDANVTLLSCEEVKFGFVSDLYLQWYKDIMFADFDYPKRTLVIGTSDSSPAKYLLVLPDNSHPDEQRIMSIDEEGAAFYDDFFEMLESTYVDYVELVEEEGL